MRALFICLENLHDPETFAAYRKDVMATLTPFEGKFLVRGGQFTVLEGAWPHERTAVLEFPSRAKAEAWYNSPAYQKVLPLRLKSMSSNAIIIDAVD
jgi:uncharacterized protein (DUF1330 family)